MALSRKISNIEIRNEGGGTDAGDWRYSFVTNDFDQDIGDVNWGSPFDEALDGSLRQNFRGFRINISLDWEKLTNSTVTSEQGSGSNTMGSFLNELQTSLADDKDNGVDISLNPDATTPDWDTYVPDNLSYRTSYTNQIGRGSSNLTFKSQQLITSIPSYLEAPIA